MLTISLKRIPNVLGIYGTGKGGIPAGDYFPPSAALLHPEAADAYMKLQQETGKRLRVSDMFRTPESSLDAMQRKAGVQPPGWSGHNFGFSIDVDVDRNLATFGMTKAQFDDLMKRYGWYCHRKDSNRGFEDWHYNYFGTNGAEKPWLDACASSRVTSAGVEARIVATYGSSFTLNSVQIQTLLQKLKLYGGALDGILGPRSRAAILAFERTWKLPEDGNPDPRMMRTLATVAADLSISG
jgi:hypothetical protein